MSSRRLQDVFKTFSRRLQDIFKTSSKDAFKTLTYHQVKLLVVVYRGVFRTLSNIYKGAFLCENT